MRWKELTSIAELDELIALSETSTVLILKHSSRCSISKMSLDRLERKWKDGDEQKAVPYFLNLLKHRDVSDAIVQRFGVQHESPQVLLIRNGKCIYSATHSEIEYGEIMETLK
ncbi:MAG: bacillithiol system redox-active protein YtxJ [Bacteroidia bacterium]